MLLWWSYRMKKASEFIKSSATFTRLLYSFRVKWLRSRKNVEGSLKCLGDWKVKSAVLSEVCACFDKLITLLSPDTKATTHIIIGGDMFSTDFGTIMLSDENEQLLLTVFVDQHFQPLVLFPLYGSKTLNHLNVATSDRIPHGWGFRKTIPAAQSQIGEVDRGLWF